MFGPYAAPAGGALIAASSLVTAAGMLIIVQCRIGAPFRMASASCITITYDIVPRGPADQDSPGKTFPLYCVFSNGISPICLNAGVVTVSLAPPLAGTVTSTSCAAPTSVSGGGAWAERRGANAITNTAATNGVHRFAVIDISPGAVVGMLYQPNN